MKKIVLVALILATLVFVAGCNSIIGRNLKNQCEKVNGFCSATACPVDYKENNGLSKFCIGVPTVIRRCCVEKNQCEKANGNCQLSCDTNQTEIPGLGEKCPKTPLTVQYKCCREKQGNLA